MPVCAKTLFEVIFPMLLDEKKQQIPAVDGVVMITVIGAETGVWTIDMRKGGDGQLRMGAVEDPGCSIVLDCGFLDDFMSGTYDPAAEMEKGRFGMTGSLALFERFANFLLAQPSKPARGETLEKPRSGGVRLRR